jgi:transcriptional regulator with XRE-family HTH domain
MPTQEWIRDLLKNQGRKLKDIAETLDISAPRVTDILKGAREVQSDEILKLANLLDLSANSLLESLSAGQLIDSTPSLKPDRITIEGTLMGDGRVLPLDEAHGIQSVAIPPDAETSEGLYCYIMGDDVLENEIKQGSIIIAADPRKHFFPMIPGAIFLIKQTDAQGTEYLLPRQYHKTETGEDWLIPLPKSPNPAFTSLRLDLGQQVENRQSSDIMNTNAFSGAPNAPTDTGKETPSFLQTGLHTAPHSSPHSGPHSGHVYTDHIFAAVLWVHRRYMAS